MKILVTGGAGFIGTNLCKRLLKEGHEVFVLDNLISGTSKIASDFKEDDKFHLINHDITEIFGAEMPEVDQIYHLASPSSPTDYKQIPLQTLWVNAAGTKNMLDLAGKFDIPLLIASSSEIYGDPLQHPQTENYYGNVNPIGVRSCYNEGKRFAESLAMNYYRHFQFPLKIVRIFNTYGPGMRKHDGRVIPEFINKALIDEPLRIHGNGKQTRSFCYIDDLIEGLILMMNSLKDFTGPVNLGNPEETTIFELAQKIIKLTGSSSLISHDDLTEDDPLLRQPDIALAKQKLNFNPKINLEEGLKKIIEYFQKGT